MFSSSQGWIETIWGWPCFPFHYWGEAQRWLQIKPPNSIISWDGLARKFLTRFFSFGKIAKLRSEILSFRQRPGENLCQAWDKFKTAFINCPHHFQANEVLVLLHWRFRTQHKDFSSFDCRCTDTRKDIQWVVCSSNHIAQGNLKWNGGSSRLVVQK